MPHQCTECGRTFADGSKEMLSGCPDCGGNKFQFLPASAVGGDSDAGATADAGTGRAAGGTVPKKPPADSADSPRSPRSTVNAGGASEASAPDAAAGRETEGDSGTSAVNRAAATVRDWVRSGGNDDRDGSPADRDEGRDDRPRTGSTRNDAPEDAAQADARSGVVSESELPDASRAGSAANSVEPRRDGEVVDTPSEESPGLKELREELNSQFESIRIVEPGQYELNLMELYEREEYIIALREDGKYVIEVPDGWETPER